MLAQDSLCTSEMALWMYPYWVAVRRIAGVGRRCGRSRRDERQGPSSANAASPVLFHVTKPWL